ncbi:AI-2E family transporter [Halomarina halobia]|uniref:AI-2E family transporter n=1 Tax=Halomarina halobia TaxID=3033386 RepID=A0ABD6A9R9_9EURY|nr:AI-2E family transporter [Halomarina sp. PSR21]
MSTERGAAERIRIQIDRREVGWWLLGFVIAGMLLLVGYRFVGTLVLGLFAYYAARPINRRLAARTGRTKAATVTLFVLVVPFLALLAGLVAAAVGQLQALDLLDPGVYARFVEPYADLSALWNDPQRLFARAQELLREPIVKRGVDTAFGVIGTLGSVFLHTTLVLALVFYLLRDDDRLAAWFRDEVARPGTVLERYLENVDRGLSTAYYGQMLTVIVVMFVAAVVYTGLNLVAPPGLTIPQPVLLAVLTGLATFIPLIGRGIVYTAVLLLLIVQVLGRGELVLLWFPALYYAVTFFGIDSLIRYFVRPYLSGRSLHTGLMLFAYLLGAAIFGWYGVFLAPLLLVGSLEFVRVVFPRLLAGDLGSESPADAARPGAGDAERASPPPTGPSDEETPAPGD